MDLKALLRPHLIEAGVPEASVEMLEQTAMTVNVSYLDFLCRVGVVPADKRRVIEAVLQGYVHLPMSKLLAGVVVPREFRVQPSPAPPGPEPTSGDDPVIAARPSLRDGAVRAGGNVGRFRLHEKLGQGALGSVFKSFDETRGAPVAIKVFRPELSNAKVIEGAVQLTRLVHPNVARVFEVNPTPFHLVLEFVGTKTLADVLESSGALHHARAVALGIQIASALRAARVVDALHHEVKPGHVLISEAGQAKLIDFGTAVMRSDQARLEDGAASYRAPEQILRPCDVDERADMYGLGAVLYHAVSGRPPLLKDTPADTLRAQIHEDPVPLRERVRGIPEATCSLVQRLLAKKPEARFDSWAEVIAVLEDANAATAEEGAGRATRHGSVQSPMGKTQA